MHRRHRLPSQPQFKRLLTSRQALRARRVLPGARHVILHGCGHVPPYDDPEQVARVLLESSRPAQAPATPA